MKKMITNQTFTVATIIEVTAKLNYIFGENEWALGGSAALILLKLLPVDRILGDIDICTTKDFYGEYEPLKDYRQHNCRSGRFFDDNGDEIRCFSIVIAGTTVDIMYRKLFDISKCTKIITPVRISIQPINDILKYKEMILNAGQIHTSEEKLNKHLQDWHYIRKNSPEIIRSFEEIKQRRELKQMQELRVQNIVQKIEPHSNIL